MTTWGSIFMVPCLAMTQTRSRCFDSPSDNRKGSVILKRGCSSLVRNRFIPLVLVEYTLKMCSSRKYPYPPQRGSMDILRGVGISKAKRFKENYLAQPKEIWNQKTPMGRVWIFSIFILWLMILSVFNKHRWPMKSVGYFTQRSRPLIPLNLSN